MIEEIKQYRLVLDELTSNHLYPDSNNIIRIEWTSSKVDVFKYQRMSHEYSKKVYHSLLESSMQLGNLLKHVSDSENPYREAALKRLQNDTDYIPKKSTKDKSIDLEFLKELDKVDSIDHIREMLLEITNKLTEVKNKLNTLEDPRVDIHIDEAISKVSIGRNYCGKILGCIKNIRETNETS